MSNYKQYINLLRETSTIIERNEKFEHDTGYKFNIFSITKIERFEVNTHSAMIIELLNPNGSHGQGVIFLKKFIQILDIENYHMDFTNVKVFKEVSFNKGKDRIDIFISFSNFTLIIENKIDAEDQESQIFRYNKVADGLNKKHEVFYLTKHGNSPPENSHKHSNYKIISYEKDITEWLLICIKEVALVPIVRQVIAQYLSLVNKIVGKNMNAEYEKEVVNLLLENSNLKTAFSIQNSIRQAKIEVQLKFWKCLVGYLSENKHQFEFYAENGNSVKNIETAVDKYYSSQNNRMNYGYRIFLEERIAVFIKVESDFYFGFQHYVKDIPNNIRSKIEKIPMSFQESSNGDCVYQWKTPERTLNFKQFNEPNVLELLNKEYREKAIEDIAKEVIMLVMEFNKEI